MIQQEIASIYVDTKYFRLISVNFLLWNIFSLYLLSLALIQKMKYFVSFTQELFSLNPMSCNDINIVDLDSHKIETHSETNLKRNLFKSMLQKIELI